MEEDFEIDIIDEEEIKIEEVVFAPILKPTKNHFNSHKVGSRYVSKILFNYVILYSIVVLIVMNLLSNLINTPVSFISSKLDIDSNLIMAVISALLLVIFNFISLFIAIKSNSNYKKTGSINTNFVHVRLMFFAFTLPVLNALVSVTNFYLYIKEDVTDFYTTSFLLLNALVLLLNPLFLLTLSKKIKKTI